MQHLLTLMHFSLQERELKEERTNNNFDIAEDKVIFICAENYLCSGNNIWFCSKRLTKREKKSEELGSRLQNIRACGMFKKKGDHVLIFQVLFSVLCCSCFLLRRLLSLFLSPVRLDFACIRDTS